MTKQLTSRLNLEEQAKLHKALSFIGERKVDGSFSKRALKLQEEHHSSVSILKKLRSTKVVKHK